jgi:hypothetical protein
VSGAPFRVGQRVRHAQFGEGRVRALLGRTGRDLKVEIDFASIGPKKVIARFLEPL